MILRMEPRSSYLQGMYCIPLRKQLEGRTIRREEEKLEAWSRKSREWKQEIANGELLSSLRARSGVDTQATARYTRLKLIPNIGKLGRRRPAQKGQIGFDFSVAVPESLKF